MGKKHSEETRKKIGLSNSISQKGKRNSIESNIKRSNTLKGRIFTKEHRHNLSIAGKGRIFTKEHRQKIRNRKHTWGNKISLAKKGIINQKLSYTLIKSYKNGKRKVSGCAKLSQDGDYSKGENNGNWLGGKSFEPYSKNFNDKFKIAIRKRDNRICMLCGIHKEKLKKELSVHHINYDKLLSIPENCICLCTSCHVKTNSNRKHWTTFFQNLLIEKYRYKYCNNEIIMEIC